VSEDGRVSTDWGDPDPTRAWQPGTEPVAQGPQQWPYYVEPGTFPPNWGAPPPREPLSVRLVHDGSVFAAAVAGLVLLGAPFALLWRAVARPAEILHTASGPQPVAPESSQMFAVDGWFVVLSIVAGVVLGCVAWALLRGRGPAAPAGIAVGGVFAGLVASAVGRRMVVDRYLYDFCHKGDVRCFVYDGTLHLHAVAAVVVLPAAMLAAFAVLTMAFDREG
jgi:hypothetical protein